MGTRADFYTQKDTPEGWLGSVAWDGHPDGVPDPAVGAETLEEFTEAVAKILAEDESGTTPDMGWPWPWDDSQTTDYAYVWSAGSVKAYCFARPLPFIPESTSDEERERLDEESYSQPKVAFPDMSELKAVTYGKRSGVMVFLMPR